MTGALQSAIFRPESGSTTTWGNKILNREVFGQNSLLFKAKFTQRDPFSPYQHVTKYKLST